MNYLETNVSEFVITHQNVKFTPQIVFQSGSDRFRNDRFSFLPQMVTCRSDETLDYKK